MRQLRPAPGAPEEREAITAFFALVRELEQEIGSAWPNVVRSAVDRGLDELLARELISADPARKLLLRRLEQALTPLRRLMELFALALEELPEEELTRYRQVSSGVEVEEVLRDPAALSVLRFELELFVALDLGDQQPLDELRYWVVRASASACRVEALLATDPSCGLPSELALARARCAWATWDSEEVDREFAPWPVPSA